MLRAVLEEYGRLKAEQTQRIGTRDNLIYTTLAALLLLAGATSWLGVDALLLVAPITTVLGWTYLVNDRTITRLGRYVSERLSSALSALLPENADPFGWERVHRAYESRTRQKAMQCFIDLLLFAGSGVAASVVVLVSDRTPLAWALAPADILLSLVLAWEIWRTGRLSAGRPPSLDATVGPVADAHERVGGLHV